MIDDETKAAMRRLMVKLSIRWKNILGREETQSAPFTCLMDYGLVEVGTEVAVRPEGAKGFVHGWFVCSGQDWENGLFVQTIQDNDLEPASRYIVDRSPEICQVRLTDEGIDARENGNWPSEPIPFRCEAVEEFIDRETEADRGKFAADANRRLYYLPSLHEGYREIKVTEMKWWVSLPGRVKRRISRDEHNRLFPGGIEVVVGQEHASFARELIARFWPDLCERIEIDGDPSAIMEASRRLKQWTGIELPESHRNWRLLSEWAGLEPDEITDEWLRERLYPRLVGMWLKRQPSEDQHGRPKPPDQTGSSSDPAESATGRIEPASVEPPDEFRKDGRPIGPLCGNRTALGFALHDDDDLSEVAYRNHLAAKIQSGNVWVRESTHSRKLEMFVRSFSLRDQYQTRLDLFAERK